MDGEIITGSICVGVMNIDTLLGYVQIGIAVVWAIYVLIKAIVLDVKSKKLTMPDDIKRAKEDIKKAKEEAKAAIARAKEEAKSFRRNAGNNSVKESQSNVVNKDNSTDSISGIY